MTGGTMSAALALHRLPSYRKRLPAPVAEANPALIGALLGVASWTGELPNSFMKRRLGIAPGEHRRSPLGVAISVLDQADWVLAACVLMRPVWKMNARDTAQAFAMVAAVHVPINLVGCAIGARAAPL